MIMICHFCTWLNYFIQILFSYLFVSFAVIVLLLRLVVVCIFVHLAVFHIWILVEICFIGYVIWFLSFLRFWFLWLLLRGSKICLIFFEIMDFGRGICFISGNGKRNHAEAALFVLSLQGKGKSLCWSIVF